MLDIMLKGHPSGSGVSTHMSALKIGDTAPSDQAAQLKFIDVLRQQPGHSETPITLPIGLPKDLPVDAAPIEAPELSIEHPIEDISPRDPEYALPLPQQPLDPEAAALASATQAQGLSASAAQVGAQTAAHATANAQLAGHASVVGHGASDPAQATNHASSHASKEAAAGSAALSNQPVQTIQVASNSPLMAALERIQQAQAQVTRLSSAQASAAQAATAIGATQTATSDAELTSQLAGARLTTAEQDVRSQTANANPSANASANTSPAQLLSATAQAQGLAQSQAKSAPTVSLTAGSEGFPVAGSAEPNSAQLASQAAQATQALALTASSQASPQGALTAPLATPAWQAQLSQQVGEQVNQLVNLRFHGDQVVRLRLHPAELGPLMITMKVEDQAAQLQFMSNHSQVRQAVEQALPQLRELLAEQGIDLNESSVSDHGQQEQQTAERENTPPQGSESSQLADNSTDTSAEEELQLRVGPGRVDLFA